MRILYVAKHGQQNSADDEGAIADALTRLGHQVHCWPESRGEHAYKFDADLMLCHHWTDFDALERVRCRKAFWCFDCIDYHDRTLQPRCLHRINWVSRMTQLCDVGFMTDGDWVARDVTKKLHRLTQGADQRIVGKAAPTGGRIPILFTGISKGGGKQRESFVQEMQSRYGSDFVHIAKGIYREALAEVIAGTDIVVAPDSPVTEAYTSNRVYNVLGFGGFLLHPYCKALTNQYQNHCEIVYYRTMDHLHELIEWYGRFPNLRQEIADAGLARTMAEHTYLNRCRAMMEML